MSTGQPESLKMIQNVPGNSVPPVICPANIGGCAMKDPVPFKEIGSVLKVIAETLATAEDQDAEHGYIKR
ncbi:MAG: hypothetical protein MZU95_00660 [Desulfomicrobium escambiense]|nr:hypothetical protein [Desulfomicrobium escambiense]